MACGMIQQKSFIAMEHHGMSSEAVWFFSTGCLLLPVNSWEFDQRTQKFIIND